MAKLKLRIPTLETVPEAQRALYRAMDGGGFILDHEPDPDGYGIDNLAAIRGKLDEKGRDFDRVNTRLQAFKKADGSLYTAEELQVLVGQNNDLTKTVETLKDKSKTSEQVIQESVTRAKQPLEAELAKMKGSVERYRTSSHNAERSRVVGKGLDILKPQDRWRKYIASDLERRIEIRELDDGTLTHVILDDNRKPRMSSLTGRDGAMDIEEYAKGAEMRTAFGDLLQGDGKQGADITQPNDGGRNQPPRKTGGNVVLPKGYTQVQFENAYKQAKEQGGEVVLPSMEGQAAN